MIRKILFLMLTLLTTQNVFSTIPVAEALLLIPTVLPGLIVSSVVGVEIIDNLMFYGAQYGARWDGSQLDGTLNGANIGALLGAMAGSAISLPTMFAIWGGLSLGTHKLASLVSKYYRHKMAYLKNI